MNGNGRYIVIDGNIIPIKLTHDSTDSILIDGQVVLSGLFVDGRDPRWVTVSQEPCAECERIKGQKK